MQKNGAILQCFIVAIVESALIETVQQSECVTMDPQCGKLPRMTYEHPGAACNSCVHCVHCGNVLCALSS